MVPVLVGDDWQAVLLWKALFDAGVYTNVALHPAVPPGGALLRTSLMATHERDHLDRALDIFGRVIADFPDLPRADREAASAVRSVVSHPPVWVVSACPISNKSPDTQEKLALSERLRDESGASC